MRRLLVLILLTSSLSAAVQPENVHEKHRDAPEILKVRIAETKLVPLKAITCAERFSNPGAEGSQVLSRFTGKLKVLQTLRSASGLKPGAVITIHYDVYEPHCPGWVGPAQAAPLKKGEVLYGFLYGVTKTDSGLIATGYAFSTMRPKVEPVR